MTDRGKTLLQNKLYKLSQKAFTLIELLVVIAIIGLLLSVIVPSLQKARQFAQKIACKAHLKSYGIALSAYNSNYKDWLPGPNTSGVEYNPNIVPTAAESSPTFPVQNMDWASPLLGDDLGLPNEREKRLAELLNAKLKCPANKEKYTDFYPSGSDWLLGMSPSDIYYSSYSASLGFHVYSSQDGLTNVIDDSRISVKVELPKGYRPKIAGVGMPSMKIFVMDGARYVNSADSVTFNAFPKQIDGGNFMLYGPSIPNSGDPFLLNRDRSLRPENLRYGWRHNKAFNVLFFDGHVDTLKVEDSLKTSYYFPRGSFIKDASRTQDPDDSNGRI